MKTIQCRAHGGTFQIQPKRGRPPVNCSPDNVCSRHADIKEDSKPYSKQFGALREAKAILDESPAEVAQRWRDSTGTEPVEVTATATAKVKVADPTLTMAVGAKTYLEGQGWTAQGSSWVTDPREHYVFGSRTMTGGEWRIFEVLASRGEETIHMVWCGGELLQQSYSLWNMEQPSRNDKPDSRLSFDPDSCTDTELVRALSGMRVTWWNKLGGIEETAIVSGESVKIEHSFNSVGDELPADRIVKFIDHGGAGYRAFRVAALLKVG